MTLIQHDFPSWYDFITCVSDEKLFAWKPSNRDSHKTETKNGWSGTETFSQAIEMALHKEISIYRSGRVRDFESQRQKKYYEKK